MRAQIDCMVVQRAQFEEMLVHRGKKDDHVDLLKNKVKKYEKERVVLLSAMFAFSLCCCFHDGSSFVFPNKLYFIRATITNINFWISYIICFIITSLIISKCLQLHFHGFNIHICTP